MRSEIGPKSLRFTRRQIMLAGGTGLVGLTLGRNVFASLLGDDTKFPGVTTLSGAKKPVFVPAANSTDPVAHSIAESLFWVDQEAEHARFFIMHMPSPELDAQRSQAQQFQNQLTGHLDKVRAAKPDRSGLGRFNQTTIDLIKRFGDFKRQLEEAQKSGKVRSLAWPTFFEHTALEGERFINRLEQLSKGNVELDRKEVIDFWSRIMADHADFIAHLLDPEERVLIEKAMNTAKAWRGIEGKNGQNSPTLEKSLEETIAFKKTAGAGVNSGQIKSIIHPALADHVLREALKFSDELKRTDRPGGASAVIRR